MKPAPIILFTYNRPQHVHATVEALKKNELSKMSDLIIYSDGAKDLLDQSKVNEVRRYLRTIDGFNSIQIIECSVNRGPAKSIIIGVTEIINKFNRAIVLEDDLITSPYFLRYMNEALVLYECEDCVISIHGYMFPVSEKLPETFFLRGADCLGWATWKRGWDLFEADGQTLLDELKKRDLTRQFDFNGAYRYTRMLKLQIAGKTNSWAIRWYASAFIYNKLTLYPGTSLIQHSGNDNTGTNFGTSSFLDVTLSRRPISLGNIDVMENVRVRKIVEDYLRNIKTPLWAGAIAHVNKFLKRSLKKVK